jgi:hypothetical protein
VTKVEREDGQGIVTVEALDRKGEFLNFLDAQVGVVTPEKGRMVVPLQQVAPGRYRGAFPAPAEGVYLLGSSQRKDQKTVGSQLAGLVVPYAAELRELGTDEAFLQELSGVAGGGVLSRPEEAFQLSRRKARLHVDLWPWLAALVVLLMILEVAVRRLGTTWITLAMTRLRRSRKGA